MPNAWIHKQIDVLNRSYAGFYGGADTGFRFESRRVRPHDERPLVQHDPGRARTSTRRSAQLRQGGADALNIYTVDGGESSRVGVLPPGYACRPHVDGVIIAFALDAGQHDPRVRGVQPRSSRPRTRAGHWLGLYHTFQGGCNAKGDHVVRHARREGARLRVPGRPGHRASRPGSIRSITTWTTRTTPATSSSPQSQGERMQQQYLFFPLLAGRV